MTSAVGIVGLGACLPDRIRTNDWWPAATVARWRAPTIERNALDSDAVAASGERAVRQAMAAYSADPFHGARERRVLADHVPSSGMERAACREAITRAGIEAQDIDFVLGQSAIPDHLGAANACSIHHQLGLRDDCLVLTADGSFNAFSTQMCLARALIANGSGQVGLLFQSSAMTRVVPPEAPYSPWFGDGATAVVVSRVRPGYGLLSAVHGVDGSLHRAMVTEVEGRAWYDDGPVTWHPGVHTGPGRLLLGVAMRARDVMHRALDQARMSPDEVALFAAHQPTVWFREVTQEHAGLHGARFLDTFPQTGSLGAANAPLVLYRASVCGLIADGDVAVVHTGGLGATWSALALRWGR